MSASIHQEIVFKASPSRIYEILTSAEQFSEATGGAPAEINPEVGGSFSCFGGHIVGRNVELLPNQADRTSLASCPVAGWRIFDR